MTTGVHPSPTGILRPSQAPRWANCAGSFALEALYPEDEDGPAAREGTAAHFYVTEYLLGRAHPIGTLAPNGHPIDADMVEHGQIYIDDVKAELPKFETTALFRVETKVFAHRLIHPENEGTPDTFAISVAQKRLILWDYKYGHKYVDAFRNWQLIDYVAGIFESLDLTREDVADMRISLRVVQPRNYHPDGVIRTWETTGAQIWPLIEWLATRAHEAKKPAAPTQTGPWCRDCDGRHACAAFMNVAHRAMDVAGETIPVELPASALGIELRRIDDAIKRLEARRDGLQEQALSMIRRGSNVPLWTMGFVQSRERWKVPLAEVVLMGDMMGVNLRKDDALTPAQARKAGIDATVIAVYSEKPTGAAKLIPSDATAAEKAFG